MVRAQNSSATYLHTYMCTYCLYLCLYLCFPLSCTKTSLHNRQICLYELWCLHPCSGAPLMANTICMLWNLSVVAAFVYCLRWRGLLGSLVCTYWGVPYVRRWINWSPFAPWEWHHKCFWDKYSCYYCLFLTTMHLPPPPSPSWPALAPLPVAPTSCTWLPPLTVSPSCQERRREGGAVKGTPPYFPSWPALAPTPSDLHAPGFLLTVTPSS